MSKHFDDQWATEQLTHALSVGKCEGIFEEEISVRLAEARTVPAAAIVEALEQAVNSDQWGVISIHPASAMEILRRGLSEGGQAREKAEKLVDRLSPLGQIGFSDLVRE